MKVILAGQKSFGATAFDNIRNAGHDIVQVFAPMGDALAFRADQKAVPVEHEMTADRVMEGADLIVCAHSHVFVSSRSRDRTVLGAIGYHPSLLPRHRGRDAVKWTIRMGDPVAGGSVYWLNDRVDGGPIAAQDWCHVDPRWDHSDLWREELFPMGQRLLVQVLADLEKRTVVRIPQAEACATWEPALDVQRLHRPDLLQLPAPGAEFGYHVVTSR